MSAPAEIPLRNARSLLNLAVVTGLALVAGVETIVQISRGDHTTAGRVFGIAFGALLLIAGVFFGLATYVASRPRTLVVDADGLHWRTSREAWRVRWSELATVAVHVGRPTGQGGWRPPYRVHLVMTTTDPGFRARHPEFDHLRGAWSDSGPDRVGIPFANRRDLVAPIDAALRTFAGDCHRDVVDDGLLTRPGYRADPRDDGPAH